MPEDSLALAAGPNIYAYVLNDPLNDFDPTGNCPWCIAAGVGALVGGGLDLGIQLVANGGHFSQVSWTSVGISALAGAGLSGLGPTGWLLGRGGVRAAQFGYSESAGLLNQGVTRFGWSFNSAAGEDVLSLRVGSTHFDIPGTGVPAVADPVGNGMLAGALAGAAGGTLTPTDATGAVAPGGNCPN